MDANTGKRNEKCSFLNDIPFTLCLRQEIEFLNSGDMKLLIDPIDIYLQNDVEPWNDSMAYLSDECDSDTNTKKQLFTPKKNKEVLKSGFLVTGRPKKIYALKIPNASIDSDNLNNKWYQ